MTGPDWQDNQGVVVLPGGARVRGRRLAGPASPADFALLLAKGPVPPWSNRRIRWRDFWIPTDRRDAFDALREAHRRAYGGERVEIACRGGRGRTGTALAALAILDDMPASQAIDWVRGTYHRRAVETPWQRWWLHTLDDERDESGLRIECRSSVIPAAAPEGAQRRGIPLLSVANGPVAAEPAPPDVSQGSGAIPVIPAAAPEGRSLALRRDKLRDEGSSSFVARRGSGGTCTARR